MIRRSKNDDLDDIRKEINERATCTYYRDPFYSYNRQQLANWRQENCFYES